MIRNRNRRSQLLRLSWKDRNNFFDWTSNINMAALLRRGVGFLSLFGVRNNTWVKPQHTRQWRMEKTAPTTYLNYIKATKEVAEAGGPGHYGWRAILEMAMDIRRRGGAMSEELVNEALYACDKSNLDEEHKQKLTRIFTEEKKRAIERTKWMKELKEQTRAFYSDLKQERLKLYYRLRDVDRHRKLDEKTFADDIDEKDFDDDDIDDDDFEIEGDIEIEDCYRDLDGFPVEAALFKVEDLIFNEMVPFYGDPQVFTQPAISNYSKMAEIQRKIDVAPLEMVLKFCTTDEIPLIREVDEGASFGKVGMKMVEAMRVKPKKFGNGSNDNSWNNHSNKSDDEHGFGDDNYEDH